MRLSDLLSLSYRNLKRRKTRTFLTVLGVIIGSTSIVVMLSLGIGMSRSMMSLYEKMGSLTTININDYGGNIDDKTKTLITDESLMDLKKLPHVTGVSPEITAYVQAKCGAYEGSIQIAGVGRDYLKQLDIGEGELPKEGDRNLKLIYGNILKYSGFHKPSNYEDVEIDPMKDMIFYKFDPSFNVGSETMDESALQKFNKKYLLECAGVLKGGPNDYSDNSFKAFCDIDAFKPFLKKIYGKSLVPDPKLNKKGKPYRYYVYNSAYVFVDDMKNVKDVQQQLSDMGFESHSNMEWVEQSQKTMKIVQMVLGGIGAVALLVAAIGIMNTMMMSIYERSNEIGVMKVLGCDMKDIRNMFLTESGCIGFVGGVIGLMLSFTLSFIINTLAGSMMSGMFGGESMNISTIPIFLSLFAIVFSIAVAMLAGYFPAVKAMKLSPLAAIRND